MSREAVRIRITAFGSGPRAIRGFGRSKPPPGTAGARKLRSLGDGLPSGSNRSQTRPSSIGSGAESFGSLNI